MIAGEDAVDQVYAAIRIFKGAGFELQKSNSNVPELEADKELTDDGQTYATLGTVAAETQWSKATRALLG